MTEAMPNRCGMAANAVNATAVPTNNFAKKGEESDCTFSKVHELLTASWTVSVKVRTVDLNADNAGAITIPLILSSKLKMKGILYAKTTHFCNRIARHF
jgi:hypothetical protein